MVLGKDTAAEATEHLQSLMLADNILAAQFPQLVFESLMPESGTFVWLLQGLRRKTRLQPIICMLCLKRCSSS